MINEYWATFSIYDHRTALYRQALILFDRVVIPVPTESYGDLKREEIERLEGDVCYLEEEGAAVRFDWDPNAFFDWQKETTKQKGVDAEALSSTLARDPPFATRLQLSEQYQRVVPELVPEGVDSPKVMPVYGTKERYESITEEFRDTVAERLTLEIVCKKLPVPSSDAPLQDILLLRQQPQFRHAMERLREWQMEVVPELLSDWEKKEHKIEKAGRDFERWIKQYSDAISDANFNKSKTSVLSVLAVGATLAGGMGPLLVMLSGIAPQLFELRSLVKPSWKVVEYEECAPAGVVYSTSRLYGD